MESVVDNASYYGNRCLFWDAISRDIIRPTGVGNDQDPVAEDLEPEAEDSESKPEDTESALGLRWISWPSDAEVLHLLHFVAWTVQHRLWNPIVHEGKNNINWALKSCTIYSSIELKRHFHLRLHTVTQMAR